ncbi:MAG: hypothetical protein O3B01_28135 [Planctomycetota bacterium]|nr:hypothetical protein [Planctomycetota bacterium]
MIPFPFLLISLPLIGLPTVFCEHSRWQTISYGTHSPPPADAAEFLVLDTGGSGGGFGHGDIRQHLQDVHFWNSQVGWTAGYGGVFRTRDGGLTWKRMRPQGGWYHLEMSGPQEVWLLEGFHGQGKAKLWHTTDDGEQWTEIASETFKGYTDLFCRANDRWLLCGGYPSYRSHDGGKTWKIEHTGGLLQNRSKIAIPADVQTPEGYMIYVLGDQGRDLRLIRSHDSGRTWSVVPLPEMPAHHAWQMTFVTSRRGWLGGPQGEILFTEDGGQTWERRDLPTGTDQRVMSLWFAQTGHGFVSVENRNFAKRRDTLYETSDNGKHWWPVLGGVKSVNKLFGMGPGQLWGVGTVPDYVPNDLVAILKPRG